MANKKLKPTKITKGMTFAEVMSLFPETMPVFLEHGMSCFGCPMSMSETVEQGANAHGINPEKLVAELNKAIGKKLK
jgi:hybrid cluster-associated redox disulfide protein